MQRFSLLLLLIVFNIISCSRKQAEPPVAIGAVPTDAQLRWHEMELNAFVHFTINTFTDKEWGFGDENPSLFNPTAPDVDQWVRTLKEAGFRGVILTTKHHDGFCLWPSQFTEHSIKNSPYKDGKGDLVKDVADACRRHDMKFGIYVSPWDRNHPDYGSKKYVEYYRAQLKELFDNYGPVFEMWFDGANGGDGYYGGARERRKIDGSTYYDWPGTLQMISEMSPDVLFFSDAGPHIRWVGNEKGIAGATNWNTMTPDTLYAGKAGIENLLQSGSENGTHWIPAEVDVSIRPGWFYHPKEDSLVKTPEQLFDIYLTSVGRGSTLLLNVPPDRRGIIHERDVQALKNWKNIIDSVFAHNLAKEQIEVTASAFRGEDERFNVEKAIDDDPETYWSTDDDQLSASVEIAFEGSNNINYVVLQEYIRLGQRIKSFNIEIFKDGSWSRVAEGTTIGYKRIVKIDNVTAQKLRINFTDAKACPVISNIALY